MPKRRKDAKVIPLHKQYIETPDGFVASNVTFDGVHGFIDTNFEELVKAKGDKLSMAQAIAIFGHDLAWKNTR